MERQSARQIAKSGVNADLREFFKRKATTGQQWRMSALMRSLVALCDLIEQSSNLNDETRAALENCRTTIRLVDDSLGLGGELHIKKEVR